MQSTKTTKKYKKAIIAGRDGTGKNTIFSIIFANSPAYEEENKKVDEICFLGDLQITIFDTTLSMNLNKEILTQKLSDVRMLIYVFDGTQANFDNELKSYSDFIKLLLGFSQNFKTFLMIHKFDQILEKERKPLFEIRKREIESKIQNIEISSMYATSIWDETLYQSWCSILNKMIDNPDILHERLREICSAAECFEAVLFDKTTFGIISKHNIEGQKEGDLVRHERLSVLLKQTRYNYSKMGITYGSIVIKNPTFTVFFQEFTVNTFIMLAFKGSEINPSLIEMNVETSRNFFKKYPIKVMDWNIQDIPFIEKRTIHTCLGAVCE